MCKHPEVTVPLVGTDSNAFALLARCTQAARMARVPKAEIDAFVREATAGDYDHLLTTCCAWWDVV
jgi:hypothetical protein